MSLADINNPKAAAELIDRFRRRFSSKTCMAPHPDHQGPIVSAHTLSVEAMLRPIAIDSHVYTGTLNIPAKKSALPIEIRKRGIKDVTVFNGFCQKHDRDLFLCLEREPFRFHPQQSFILAYRAVARECYLKRKQYESLPTPDEVGIIHGINENLQLSLETILYQAACLRGAEETEQLKATFDRHLMNQAWNRTVTRAIIFPQTPTVLATVAFQPFYDMNGEQLQNPEDLKAEMSQVCMSVIPIETGGAAIFTWVDSVNAAPSRFFESVAQGPDMTAAVIHAIFDNTENFAINPEWYEQLSETDKDYIYSRMMLFEHSTSYAGRSRPDQSAPKLADWGRGVVSTF